MAKKTIHYVLSHCHALCASRHPPPPPRSLLHSPLVHSRAFAFEIIAAAFCMHSRWQLSGNGWTSASRASSSELAREVAHKFHWACSGRVSSNIPLTDTNSQSQLLPCPRCLGECCHETESGAGASRSRSCSRN